MTGGILPTWLDQALDAVAVAVVGVEWYDPLPDDSDDAAGPVAVVGVEWHDPLPDDSDDAAGPAEDDAP